MKPTDRDIIAAFAVLGLAWLDRLPTVGDAIHAAVHPALALAGDGLWRPGDPALAEAYPEGLTLTEALGWTLASTWANKAHCPVLVDTTCDGRAYQFSARRHRWILMFDGHDGAMKSVEAYAEETEKVAAAWLTIRLAMRPTVPWGPRDGTAEELRRHVRDASAYVRPAKVERLVPETIASDLGRNWRTGS